MFCTEGSSDISHQCTVLIVEDDPAILSLVAETLTLAGYAVQTATNGEEALAAVRQLKTAHAECPAVVLLDKDLPNLDGWGVAQELQQQELQVPLVAMTAADNAANWAQQIAAESYLNKPFSLDELVATVGRYVRPQPRHGEAGH